METMYDNTKKSKLTNTTKTNYYQVDYANEVTRLQVEKQQLISFLEDKIKEIDKTIPSDLICAASLYADKLAKLNAYQEVLDFVNGDGKE